MKHITYLSLSQERQWTTLDGKAVFGKLIAFEDLTVETPKGAAELAAQTPPEHPAVVKAGKVRLLVNRKPFEVSIGRLSPEDQRLVEGTRALHAPPPPA